MPQISVVIPVYNAEKYLGECIDSVLAQLFADFEVVIVDDGSTDSSSDIVNAYASRDKRVRYIRQTNAGPSAARNTGIDAAEGDWLVFVDSDDTLMPNALQRFVETARKTSADIVCSGFTTGGSKARKQKSDPLVLTPVEAIRDIYYQKRIDPAPWAKMYRKSVWNGVRFRTGIIYEDLDSVFPVFRNARGVAYIPDRLYFYRPTPSSLMRTFHPARFDVLDVTRRIEDNCKLHEPALLRAAADRRLSACFNMLGLIAAHKTGKRYEAHLQECRDVVKRYRLDSLTDPHVRFKNKAGILLSYMGYPVMMKILGLYYGR